MVDKPAREPWMVGNLPPGRYVLDVPEDVTKEPRLLAPRSIVPDGLLDLAELREAAEKHAVAYARMVEINEGIGGLGYHHPEMFMDMEAWDERTTNDHADVVLGLLDRIGLLQETVLVGMRIEQAWYLRAVALEEALTDYVTHMEAGQPGARVKMSEVAQTLRSYLREVDEEGQS